MSVNGIVRRIDELGRIVIPKEIRRTMRLSEGDEMEILAEENRLILRRYSQFEGCVPAAEAIAKMIREYTGAEAFVVTTDRLVAASGGKAKYAHSVPSVSLSKLVAARSSVVVKASEIGELFDADKKTNAAEPDKTSVNIVNGASEPCIYCEPVTVFGDLVGAVVVRTDKLLDENKTGYVRFASALLSAVLAGR